MTTNNLTYKIVHSRPAIQEGGLHAVYFDEYWLPSSFLATFRRILESLSRDQLIDHFPYKFCIETPTGAPQVGRCWAELFTLYPVVNGVAVDEVKFWVARSAPYDPNAGANIEDPSLSPAHLLADLMSLIAEPYQDNPKFNYGGPQITEV